MLVQYLLTNEKNYFYNKQSNESVHIKQDIMNQQNYFKTYFNATNSG